jgi:hypothetical protein
MLGGVSALGSGGLGLPSATALLGWLLRKNAMPITTTPMRTATAV